MTNLSKVISTGISIIAGLLLAACSTSTTTTIETLTRAPAQSATATETPVHTPTSTTFEVQANYPWQNTGLEIEAGNQVRIQYVSGSWTTWQSQHPYVDAQGNVGFDYLNPDNPVPDAYPGVLVAKIGYGSPLQIGNKANLKACNSGALYLKMNDDYLEDNDGSIVVEITISASSEFVPCPPSATSTPTIAPTPVALTPTATPELNAIEISRTTTDSPNGEWMVQIEMSEPVLREYQEASFYTRVIVIKQDSQAVWIPIAEWREYGLGYDQPIVFHWSNDGKYLYLAEYAIPDGCPGFGFTSSIKRIHLSTGKVEPVTSQLFGVLSISPDETTLVALNRDTIKLHNLQSGQERVIQYKVEAADFWISGNIVWSPSSSQLLFAAIIDGCSPPEMETSSLFLVNTLTEEVNTLVVEDERRLTIQEWTSRDKVLLMDRDGQQWLLDVNSGEITTAP